MSLAPRLPRLVLIGLVLGLGACAAAPPPAPVAPSVVAPAPPSPLEIMVAARRDKAQTLEQGGRLREALNEWKIALTLSPADPTAGEGRKRVEDLIERGVADRVRQGKEALGRGDPLSARRHFLAALALDPANPVAFEALQNEVKEIRTVNHLVRVGESLATIAQAYYGDRARAEVIWETNQLPPNPRLTAGTVLRIPEIPGVPFVHPDLRPRPPAEPASAGTPKPEGPRPEGPRPDVVESNPLLMGAKEALDRGEYLVALADVDKVLASDAKNAEGVDLKKVILYGLGKAQLGQRRFEQSYQTLTQLARLAPGYQDASALLRQARDGLVQLHYSQGVRLFQEEKLEEAIARWRAVLEYDPQHANARRNIEQAERLLKSLQQRQQPQKKP